MMASQARIRADGHNFTPDFRAQTPPLFFVLMPAFALLLAGVCRSRRRSYATHLVVSLHLHAFAFLVFTASAAAIWRPWPSAAQWIEWAVVAWIAVSSVVALRRVYGGSAGSTVLRAGALAVSYSVTAIAALTAMAFVISLMYAGG